MNSIGGGIASAIAIFTLIPNNPSLSSTSVVADLTISSAVSPLFGTTPILYFSLWARSLLSFPATPISHPIAPASIIVVMVQLAARLNAVPLATICAVLCAIILGFSSGLSTSETAICGLGRLNFWATLSVSSLIPVSEALGELAELRVGEADERKISHGMPIEVSAPPGRVRVLSSGGGLLAVAEVAEPAPVVAEALPKADWWFGGHPPAPPAPATPQATEPAPAETTAAAAAPVAPPPAPVRALAERLSAEGREALARIEAQLATLERVELAKRSLEWHEAQTANGRSEDQPAGD